jgi:glycosyltransferase involved in cell wall biosynthesis
MLERNLLVICDTKAQFSNGQWYLFSSVANEIKYLQTIVNSITIICTDYTNEDFDISLNLMDKNVKIIALPKIGGPTIISKVKSIIFIPIYCINILRYVFSNNIIHLRAPNSVTLLAFFVIPFFQMKTIWVKYATNWKSAESSLNYAIQKWICVNILSKSKITINGFWPNQPTHCISFENPCLTDFDIREGSNLVAHKLFKRPFDVIFVGRIDSQKGVDIIIEFLESIDCNEIRFFHVVGEGKLKNKFEQILTERSINFCFYGCIQQSVLFEILKKSHCILLPSRSEGFPKVLAEAMNFGCIPIASNVGSIEHYIANGQSGLILKNLDSKCLIEVWNQFLNLSVNQKNAMMLKGNLIAHAFSYGRYLLNLEKYIYHDN